MGGALWIPGADRTTRWFFDNFPNAAMPRIDKTLLHSTETQKRSGCPGYAGGATAPGLTINPWRGYQRKWQHFPINRPGRALGNPASTPVSENKDNVFQIEVIGFSDPALGRRYGCYLPELADDELEYLAETIAFVHKEWPHPTTIPKTWPLYKVSSNAAMRAAHMTSAEYDRFAGILAHEHAPIPSTHGDIAVNIRALVQKIDRRLAPPKPEKPTTAPPPTTTTSQEIDVVLVQIKGTDPVYKTDGMTRQHIGPKQRAGLLKAGYKQIAVADQTELDAYGPLVPNPFGQK